MDTGQYGMGMFGHSEGVWVGSFELGNALIEL
jgi:hypothetical protein